MRLGVIMDPINRINYKKDSTLAMLLEAQARHWKIYYFEQKNLYLRDSVPFGEPHLLEVFADPTQWFRIEQQVSMPLSELDVILMRKDPPFNEKFIYTTYILEHAERLGVLIVNRPQALRDANEKFFAAAFPQCAPPTLITSSKQKLFDFWHEYSDIVCKPLNSMGGMLVFRLQKNEVNANVVFDILTQDGSLPIMAQKYIPEITQGDKRILLIDGKPIDHALVRIPQGNDWRGNLAVGAKASVQPLTARDHFICKEVAPLLRERGLIFVGIDVIGDYLTEVNVTSPTGIRELDDALDTHIAAKLLDWIEHRINA